MDTNWIVALTIAWLIGWCPVNGKVNCREVQLARDCEALCKKNQDGVSSCELRVAVLLPADPRFDIALPKVLPVLGKFSLVVQNRRCFLCDSSYGIRKCYCNYCKRIGTI